MAPGEASADPAAGGPAAPAGDGSALGAPAADGTVGAPTTPPPNGVAPTPPPEDPGAPFHTVAGATGESRSFHDAKFSCCKDENFTPVMAAYAGMTAALATDAKADAQAAVDAFRASVKVASSAAGVDPQAVGELKKMDDAAKAMSGKELVDMRAGLKALSPTAVIFARAHSGGPTTLVEVYCAGDDAAWLQSPEAVANPYAGPSDAPCGEFR